MDKLASNQVGRSEIFGLHRFTLKSLLRGSEFILYHGLTMEDFTFATVVESKPQKSVQGLAKPFDKTTWILLLSWTFIFILFAHTLKSQNLRLELVFTIIEQSTHRISLEGTKGICLWIYFSWSILAIVLSSTYKGKVFELISNPTYPPTPWFLEEIFYMSYVVTSFQSYGYPGHWKSIIQVKIADFVEDANAGVRAIHDLDTYTKLNENLIWATNEFKLELHLGNLLKHGILHDSKRNKRIEVKNSPVVFIDLKSNVQLLQQLVTIATDKKCTFGEQLSAFGTRRHFLTKEEWYARLVGPYFATYAEFGIQARWLWFQSVKHMFHTLHIILTWWRQEETEIGEQMQSINILESLLAGKKLIGRRPSPEPMKFDHFQVLGTPMLYLLLIAVIIFVGEISYHCYHSGYRVRIVKVK